LYVKKINGVRIKTGVVVKAEIIKIFSIKSCTFALLDLVPKAYKSSDCSSPGVGRAG
jgi:hypothetical protein